VPEMIGAAWLSAYDMKGAITFRSEEGS